MRSRAAARSPTRARSTGTRSTRRRDEPRADYVRMRAEGGVLTELGLHAMGRLDGGEQGALAVEDSSGMRQVLKVFTLGELDRLTVAIDVATQRPDGGVRFPAPYGVAA